MPSKQFVLNLSAWALLIISCVGTAKISDFPKSASLINFERYSTEMNGQKQPFWTFETSNEYYLESTASIDAKELDRVIQDAVGRKGYQIVSHNIPDSCLIGKRGMTANDWGSVAGVYYRFSPGKIQIYIRTKISQDATGGARNNLAKKIGVLIEQSLKTRMTN
jgi:hypothetical protein